MEACESHGLFQFASVDSDDEFFAVSQQDRRKQDLQQRCAEAKTYVPRITTKGFFLETISDASSEPIQVNKDILRHSFHTKSGPGHILNSIEYLYMKQDYSTALSACLMYLELLKECKKTVLQRDIVDASVRCLKQLGAGKVNWLSREDASRWYSHIQCIKDCGSLLIRSELAFLAHLPFDGFLAIQQYIKERRNDYLAWKSLAQGCCILEHILASSLSTLHTRALWVIVRTCLLRILLFIDISPRPLSEFKLEHEKKEMAFVKEWMARLDDQLLAFSSPEPPLSECISMLIHLSQQVQSSHQHDQECHVFLVSFLSTNQQQQPDEEEDEE